MDSDELIEYDDRARALSEGRALRHARQYRIRYAEDGLDFRTLALSDPVPLGRQILMSAGVDPKAGYSLFAILPTGDFEDVRLDEPFDLRERGAERFVAFQTDRDYKLTLDGDQLAWGKPAIKGADLYALAKVSADEVVFLVVPGGQDRLVEPDELVDLTAAGIEQFITAPKPIAEFEIIVNARPHVVADELVTYEQVVSIAFPGTQSGRNVVFAMTYRNAASKPHAGNLGPGGRVNVKKTGTIFNVTKADKS